MYYPPVKRSGVEPLVVNSASLLTSEWAPFYANAYKLQLSDTQSTNILITVVVPLNSTLGDQSSPTLTFLDFPWLSLIAPS